MRELLSVDREANQIRMRRSTYKGTFLLVEGSTDKVFYERFVDKSACELISISGKPSSKRRVIAVLKILEGDSFQGVLAIVDADCDRLLPPQDKSLNLLYTDHHDLEALLIHSPALDKVIAEFGSEEKITKFQQDIRVIILETSVSIGYLRWISQQDELNLKFEGIVFSRFINEKTLQLDEEQLVHEIKNKSQASSLKEEDLLQKLRLQQSPKHDRWQICCGHDLVEILSLDLRKAFGSNDSAAIKTESLERSLRLAYEASFFHETQLCLEIRSWERHNTPFKVLSHQDANSQN